jgi:HK97 family phage major capsid protein
MNGITTFIRTNPLRFALIVLGVIAATLLMLHGFGAHAFLIGPAVAMTLEDVTREFAEKNAELKSLGDNLRAANDEVKGRLATGEALSQSLKEAIDKALIDFNGVKGVLTELEQKLARGVEQEQKTAKSWGEQFVEGASYKGTTSPADFRGVMSAEVKTVTGAAAGGMIVSLRETNPLPLLRERRVVRDLLTTVPVTTSSVDYAIQTTRTNNAAPVAEAAAAAYSDYAWSSASVSIRNLAHLAKLTRQALDDAPRLVGEIDSEMRYGLGYVEERQFLFGSGVGQNLHGIVPQATAFAVPGGFPVMANATMVDVLRVVMLQLSIGLTPLDGFVLNDIDWTAIELTKDSVGNYIFAQPQGTVGAAMWGVPVVTTPAMTAGSFLGGAFRMGATVYDRMGVEVLISTENADDFEKSLATMRAIERVAIAVKRPGAFVTGTFAAALADMQA